MILSSLGAFVAPCLSISSKHLIGGQVASETNVQEFKKQINQCHCHNIIMESKFDMGIHQGFMQN